MSSILLLDGAMGAGIPIRGKFDVAIFEGTVGMIVGIDVSRVEGWRGGVGRGGGMRLKDEVPFEAEEDCVGRVGGGDFTVRLDYNLLC
jgi:hypothetical protein